MARLKRYGVIEQGCVEQLVVGEHRGHPVTLRWYDDDAVRVEHLCDRRHGQRPDVAPHCVVLAPALVMGPFADRAAAGRRHALRRDDDGLVWIAGSVQCLDCDLHGMVEGSSWRPV